jgi:hypothetical protein
MRSQTTFPKTVWIYRAAASVLNNGAYYPARHKWRSSTKTRSRGCRHHGIDQHPGAVEVDLVTSARRRHRLADIGESRKCMTASIRSAETRRGAQRRRECRPQSAFPRERIRDDRIVDCRTRYLRVPPQPVPWRNGCQHSQPRPNQYVCHELSNLNEKVFVAISCT